MRMRAGDHAANHFSGMTAASLREDPLWDAESGPACPGDNTLKPFVIRDGRRRRA